MWRIKMFLLLSISLSAVTWYDQKLEGWYYFEDSEEGEAQETPNSAAEAEEILETNQKNLKRLLSLAILAPSVANVENYILEQKKWINQSSAFAETWGQVLLEKPFLGDFLMNPTTNYGLLAKREADRSKREAVLQEAAKSHFLLFFFRGDNPLSAKAAEVVTLFASLHQWKVKPVSLDGLPIPGIQHEIDKGLSQKLGVEASPSFYVIDPDENKAFPVGAGLISIGDLEQNIENQLEASDD